MATPGEIIDSPRSCSCCREIGGRLCTHSCAVIRPSVRRLARSGGCSHGTLSMASQAVFRRHVHIYACIRTPAIYARIYTHLYTRVYGICHSIRTRAYTRAYNMRARIFHVTDIRVRISVSVYSSSSSSSSSAMLLSTQTHQSDRNKGEHRVKAFWLTRLKSANQNVQCDRQ